MRHNKRPPIKASSLKLYAITFDEDGRAFLACPQGCGQWAYLRRGMFPVHRPDSESSRCAGSAQRIYMDLDWIGHRSKLAKADRSLDTRRGNRVHIVANPPAPVPVCHMARTRTAA